MTTTDLLARWHAMEPRDRDRWVAEHVMQIDSKHHDNCRNYSTDGDSDHDVLISVKYWPIAQQYQFVAMLDLLTWRRWHELPEDRRETTHPLLLREPGDYSLAAFLVLGGKENA